jgi:hypothetical protein
MRHTYASDIEEVFGRALGAEHRGRFARPSAVANLTEIATRPIVASVPSGTLPQHSRLIGIGAERLHCAASHGAAEVGAQVGGSASMPMALVWMQVKEAEGAGFDTLPGLHHSQARKHRPGTFARDSANAESDHVNKGERHS